MSDSRDASSRGSSATTGAENLERPLLSEEEADNSGSQHIVESSAQRLYRGALRFIQSRTKSKTDYLGMSDEQESSTKETEENEEDRRGLVTTRSLSVLDDVDLHNGFSMSGHYSLRSSIHKKHNAVLLNEGDYQLIFEPRRRVREK